MVFSPRSPLGIRLRYPAGTPPKHRLKDLKDYDTVKIYVSELQKLGVNYGPLLYNWRNRGETWCRLQLR